MKPKIQIYILCRDRLHYTRVAIDSAIRQDGCDFEVIVSDNSEFDAVGLMVVSNFKEVNYVRRNMLSAIQHFKTVIEESSAEYVVFFHDDDVLNPSYLRCMRAALDDNPEVVAVGCNANIIRKLELSDDYFMSHLTQDVRLTNVEEFINFYLSFNKHRPAPFPSYMYRREAIKGLYLNAQDGGKHADVAFLMSLIKKGEFLWLSTPLMQYRMHGSNDSSIESVGDRLRLLRYIYRNTDFTPKSKTIQEYRFRFWARWLMSKFKSGYYWPLTWRKRVVLAYLCRQILMIVFSEPGFWRRIFSGAR